MEVKNIKLVDDKEKLKQVNINMTQTVKILEEQKSEDALFYSEWTNMKADIKFNKEIDTNLYISGNLIYWAYLGSNIGSEQDLHRPVLVVQTSKYSPICSIIPLTLERLNDGYWYHVDLENGVSTALVEHIRVISKKRIDKPMRIK